MSDDRDPAALVAGRLGLRADGAMHGRFDRALRERARIVGEAPERYARSGLADPEERRALMAAVTVQESSFFREPMHFEVLARRALPALPGPGVIWSAGCANGQEAWSLAMTLEEAGAAGWRVLGTDVSCPALARAEEGRYEERELAGVSPARRARFLRRRGDAWEAGPRLRRRVFFAEHDLVAQPPPLEAGDCRIVFCRNVLIYLEPAAADRTLEALRARMPGDAWLFVGASETLSAGTRSFAPRRVDGVYVYRPRPWREAASGADAQAEAGEAAGRERLEAGAGEIAPPAGQGGGKAPSSSLPDPAALLAEAEEHAAAGRRAEAAAAFRRASFLAPDDPLPLLGLGLALERDDPVRAARAFRAARVALRERHGGARPELARLLEAKLAAQRLQSGKAAPSTSTSGFPPV